MAFNHGSLRTDPNKIMKLKEYIDESVIFTIDKQVKQISKLKNQNQIYAANKLLLLQKNADLRFKLKDTQIQLKNEKMKTKEKDEQISDIEQMRRELEEMKKEVDAEIEELRKEAERQKEEIDELEKENNRLKNRFKLNSTNSSIPSSKQGFREVKNSREKTGRSVGGQKGHKGHFSKLSDKPDEVVTKIVKEVPAAAKAIYNDANELMYYVTQEIDLVFETKIIETRYFLDENNGQEITHDELIKYRRNNVSYSTDFKAHTLYVVNKGVIAVGRTCDMYRDMSDGQITLQPSTIKKWEKKFHKEAKPTLAEIENRLVESDCVHMDESGWKTDGDKHWIHILNNKEHARYYMVDKRGHDENGVIPILKDYTGAAVHDHFSPYYHLDKCTHIECNAHVLRYLQQGIDLDNSVACMQMMKLFQSALHERNQLLEQGVHEFTDEKIASYKVKYEQIIKEELESYEKENPGIKHKKYEANHIKLFRRLLEYEVPHLQFLHDFTMPFTNNVAENGIRQMKTHLKISTQSKSKDGANALAAITSVVQTCKLQNMNSTKAIKTILNKGTISFKNK